MRFYLSVLGAYGFYPAVINAGAGGSNNGVNIAHDLYLLADINADYLFNWVDEGEYSAGLFVGFFAGAMVSLPMQNSTGSQSIGTTLGLNLGLRTTINYSHQVEFGIKSALTLFTGQPNQMNPNASAISSLGATIIGQVSYIYKF
ncbi:outer membrane beta-barrel protein [Helicobacter didelphidarum]|uniref:outer membrane beta-barrel protein n=1 Tax=Helicobacter didelphidarum TaxID=2040648 RepID=UPI0015F12EF3|nr:outer membrane beta-barrel protein [Helicobacter didelphidarum]